MSLWAQIGTSQNCKLLLWDVSYVFIQLICDSQYIYKGNVIAALIMFRDIVNLTEGDLCDASEFQGGGWGEWRAYNVQDSNIRGHGSSPYTPICS